VRARFFQEWCAFCGVWDKFSGGVGVIFISRFVQGVCVLFRGCVVGCVVCVERGKLIFG
jgi:hypothetical protein